MPLYRQECPCYVQIFPTDKNVCVTIMIPANVEYYRPGTVREALEMLQKFGEDAKLLAGGHSLIPAMRLRLSTPSHLVDIAGIPNLGGINDNGDHIAIGAGAKHNEVANSYLIGEHLNMLAEAGNMIGDVQVRNFGTIGGSLAHADPAADWPALMLASDATIVVENLTGKREIAAADFFQGLFMTGLNDDEILTEIRIPKPPKGTRSTYQKYVQPASRFAIVGCAAMISGNGTIDNARVAFAGVSAKPFRDTDVENALTGKARGEATFSDAASKAAEGVSIMSDHFASEKYRRSIAKVYAKRALMKLI